MPQIPIKEYIFNFPEHLQDFWVPLIVALIFAGLAVKSVIGRNLPLFILYTVLVAACIGYMGYSDWILAKLNALAK